MEVYLPLLRGRHVCNACRRRPQTFETASTQHPSNQLQLVGLSIKNVTETPYLPSVLLLVLLRHSAKSSVAQEERLATSP